MGQPTQDSRLSPPVSERLPAADTPTNVALPLWVTGALDARVTDLVIRLALLGLLAYWSFTLLGPFLPIIIWSTILAVALYPLYARLAAALGGRPKLAATVVTLAAFLVVVGPIGVLATDLAESVARIAGALREGAIHVPPPSPAVREWPLIGEPLTRAWTLASTNLTAAIAEYGPALLPAGGTILAKLAAISGDVLLFLVSVIIAGFLLVPGPRLAFGANRLATRLVQPRGAQFVALAGATIRSVSRGVIGVALIQSVLAGLVLVAAGVPGAGLIAFATLLLCIVQIGPAPVLLPTLVWMWTAYTTGEALFWTVVIVPIMLIDNVLKPILMSRGLTTPILVMLGGVIGGTLTYGLAGLFLGPIVLAVSYELIVAWVELDGARSAEASATMSP
jgi:predicted PurR-regulated permease PerM